MSATASRVVRAFALALSCSPLASAQLFTDVTASSGAPSEKGYSAAPCDYDNDGDLDFALTSSSNNAFKMYRNLGNGTIQFSNATSAAGFATNLGSGRTVTFADYDNDGDPDLFMGREIGFSGSNNRLYQNNGSGVYAEVTGAAGLTATNTDPRGSVWFDYDHDGDLDLYLANARDFNGTRDALWGNNGNGTFTDVTNAAGLPTVNDPAFGSSTADFDGDGDLDIYVEAGQIGTSGSTPWPNKLLRSNLMETGSPTFTDIAPSLGVDRKGEGYATFWFDYDNDHDFDLYHAVFTNGFDVFGEANALFRNNGNATFTDIAASAGVQHPLEDNGAQQFDFDYDGLEDFYVSSFSANNPLYRNNGNQTFSVPANAGTPGNGGGSNILPGDFDADGDVDLMYISFTANKAYRNNGTGLGHFLKINLVGTQSNRDGVGAVIRVVTSDGVSRRFQRSIGSGYGSMVPKTFSIGLGANTVAETVEVVWPKSRIVQVLTNVAADQTITITESGSPTAILSIASNHSVGSPLAFNLRGTPNASATILLALGDGPVALPPYGTLLVEPTFFLFLLNGTSGFGPFLDASGKLSIPTALPNDPFLIGLKIAFQGAETVAGVTTLGNGVPFDIRP
jgi:hypothetical protein